MYLKGSITVAKKMQIHRLITASFRCLSCKIPITQNNSARLTDRIQARAKPINPISRKRMAGTTKGMYAKVARAQTITEITKHSIPNTGFFDSPSHTLISELILSARLYSKIRKLGFPTLLRPQNIYIMIFCHSI